MHTHQITLESQSAHYHSWGSSGEKAHFYGGNGFLFAAYLPLIHALQHDYHFISLAMRGLWSKPPVPKRAFTRKEDAELLIAFLEQTTDQPVVGMGHSQGASATVIAASQRPDLFSRLILIEPVSFTPWQARWIPALPVWFKNHFEPFKGALAKQSIWPSIEAYQKELRSHRAFRRFNDEDLAHFAHASLCATQDGFTLRFPPEQEVANYHGTPCIESALKSLTVPYHIISGKPSMFLSDKVRKRWGQFVLPNQWTVDPHFGHLLPLEAPHACAQLINAADSAD
ncbi:alpha/beta hydrolase [Suttonella sp. R2A3]|uniref:alpha/beta fold hydrolase n=1 Tax=Suttonella sp. R2A3 TaxID=2908648 RepID=UPI001F38CF6F|nr:alpha/beta hydrolase [Suttonella sp. R2A3]UJF24833.1 alpha/beta hydrolase [Suttonella sp. R2A3]